MKFIDSLADFVGSAVTAREFEHNGKTRTFYARELAADEAEKLYDIVGTDGKPDPKKAKGFRNRIIATCICDETGNTVLTEQEAGKLPNKLATKLQAFAIEVNTAEKKDLEA